MSTVQYNERIFKNVKTVQYTGQNLKVKLGKNVTNSEFYYNLIVHILYFFFVVIEKYRIICYNLVEKDK